MSIRISEKYGLNPSIPKCFICGGDKNEIILAGRMRNDQQAPQNVVWDTVPCEQCAAIMKRGIILISVDEAKSTDKNNPWRTGGWCAITEEAFKRIGVKPKELEDEILQKRIAFLPDETYDLLGLPRKAIEGVPSTPEEFQAKQGT